MQLLSIQVGKADSFQYKGKTLTTAINKQSVQLPIYLGSQQFIGDEQADLIHHGGIDKAVCVYAYEHYSHWEQFLEHSLPFGAFGENLTMLGMLEQDVCIGNVYRIGGALVQVSQPREPCYKLSHRHNRVDLPLHMQQTGFTGFYFRVLQEGWVGVDPSILLEKEDPLKITISFANEIMFKDKQDLEGIKRILAVEALSASWRETMGKRLMK
jgi:MOSC domain-containing protein YiiM